jgi:hypothetical protein
MALSMRTINRKGLGEIDWGLLHDATWRPFWTGWAKPRNFYLCLFSNWVFMEQQSDASRRKYKMHIIYRTSGSILQLFPQDTNLHCMYCRQIKCRFGPNMARGPKLYVTTSSLVVETLRLWSLKGWSITEFKPSYWSSFICRNSVCNCYFIIWLNCNWNHVLLQFWKES